MSNFHSTKNILPLHPLVPLMQIWHEMLTTLSLEVPLSEPLFMIASSQYNSFQQMIKNVSFHWIYFNNNLQKYSEINRSITYKQGIAAKVFRSFCKYPNVGFNRFLVFQSLVTFCRKFANVLTKQQISTTMWW